MEVVTNVALLKTGFTSLKSFIQRQKLISHQPSQILDPMSTMIRMGLLAFFSSGTKITIGNNTIVYQAPGMLQGATRWTTGSKRTELHLLCKPIVRALKHYDRNCVHFQKICRLAIDGLKKLKTSYPTDHNITLYSLNFYIHTLSNFDNDTELLDILEMKDDLNVFGKLWTPTDIKLISILFDKVLQHRTYPTRIHKFVQAIIHILEVKDECVQTIIHDTTSKI